MIRYDIALAIDLTEEEQAAVVFRNANADTMRATKGMAPDVKGEYVFMTRPDLWAKIGPDGLVAVPSMSGGEYEIGIDGGCSCPATRPCYHQTVFRCTRDHYALAAHERPELRHWSYQDGKLVRK